MSSCAADSVSLSNCNVARASRVQALETCKFQLHSLPIDACTFDAAEESNMFAVAYEKDQGKT